jgi:4-azaleucine resistance transporter AzlC
MQIYGLEQSGASAPEPSRWSELLAGARAELAILPSDLPFGLVYGAAATAAGLSSVLAVASSAIICAGSAQMIGVQLLGAGAPVLLVIVTALAVNLRHVLYGLSLLPRLGHLSRRWRWALAYLLTDESFAVVATRPEAEARAAHAHWFMVGAGVALWISWLASTALGVFVGGRLPASLSLDFAVVVTFIGLVVPALEGRAGVIAALTAAGVAVFAGALPLRLGVIVAAIAGVVAGVFADGHRK